MPCFEPRNQAGWKEPVQAVDAEELEMNERLRNMKTYGIDATNEGVARAVACELGHVLEGFPELTGLLGPTVVKWLANHRIEDAARAEAVRGSGAAPPSGKIDTEAPLFRCECSECKAIRRGEG